MKISPFAGKRIHFVGSSTDNTDPQILTYAHQLIKEIARSTLDMGGGLVVTLGPEPLLNNKANLPMIFDWTILEAVDELDDETKIDWSVTQGSPVVAVAFQKNIRRIPEHRRELWKRLKENPMLELRIIPAETSVGGVLRREQSKFGDLLVTLGGGPGTYHLKELYQAEKKPILPLDLVLDTKKELASVVLSKSACVNPKDFFDYKPSTRAVSAYMGLSFAEILPDVSIFTKNFIDFVLHLPKPYAFYVRLLDDKQAEYNDVEAFFRDVVDPVISNSGYERFEMGSDASEDMFLNIELFKRLHFSSLIIVDLTCVRPNCCFEFGYVLALSKKVILTAKKGTRLPWDVNTINCHFWSPTENNQERIKKIREFMEKNVIRGPVKKTLA